MQSGHQHVSSAITTTCRVYVTQSHWLQCVHTCRTVGRPPMGESRGVWSPSEGAVVLSWPRACCSLRRTSSSSLSSLSPDPACSNTSCNKALVSTEHVCLSTIWTCVIGHWYRLSQADTHYPCSKAVCPQQGALKLVGEYASMAARKCQRPKTLCVCTLYV